MLDVRTTDTQLAQLMRSVAVKASEMSEALDLLLVANLLEGPMVDLGPDGILNAAQYYTRRQVDEIIRSFQELGVSVHTFFNEPDFIAAVIGRDGYGDARRRIVYTMAEGGTGSGRRALIPALCNLLSLPVLNSGAHACSIARHKFHASAVLRQVGVRVPDTWQFNAGSWVGGLRPNFGLRVILKPMWESMCIGIDEDSVQTVDAEFDAFLRDKHLRLGQPVLVQEFVSGDEVGVPLARIGSTYALPPVAFRQRDGTPFGARPKTFRDQNVERNVSFVPFEASEALGDALRSTAVLAFDALDMSGAGRIDFRVDVDGRAWVFDTNESPPPVARTAYAASMEHLGFSVGEMLAVWLGVCLLEFGLISGV